MTAINPTDSPNSSAAMPQSFAEFLTQFVTADRLEVFDAKLKLRTRHIAVVLEDLYLPHNISACLRSCDAFGIQDVHVVEGHHEYRVNPSVELGSAQWLTLTRHRGGDDNSRDCVRALRQRGYRIVATSPREDAVPLEEFDFENKLALFFGGEKNGLTDRVLDAADEHLRIPMFGFAESFNISVAVAVCLHHLNWRLRNSDVDCRLSDREKSELRLEWLKQSLRHLFPDLEREYERRK